jgi:hypothetical protein
MAFSARTGLCAALSNPWRTLQGKPNLTPPSNLHSNLRNSRIEKHLPAELTPVDDELAALLASHLTQEPIRLPGSYKDLTRLTATPASRCSRTALTPAEHSVKTPGVRSGQALDADLRLTCRHVPRVF